MADHLTQLEDAMDDIYVKSLRDIGDSQVVTNWDDYNHRAGYLRAIRNIGELIQRIRNPELPVETGEIPDILQQEVKNG